MVYQVGQAYTVYNVPTRYYYSSDRAAVRNTFQSGVLSEQGTFTIVNIMWTDANNGWYQTQPASGGIALIGTDIGWFRDDDNVTPSQITSFPDMSIDGTAVIQLRQNAPNATHKVELKINNTPIGQILNVPASFRLHFNEEDKTKIYNLTPQTTFATVTLIVKTLINNKVVGAATQATAKVFIPETEKPKFTTNASYRIINPVNNSAMVGRSSLAISRGEASPGRGATIVSSMIQFDGAISNEATYTTGTLKNTNGQIIVQWIDSRGRVGIQRLDVPIVSSAPIGLTVNNVNRTIDDGIVVTAQGTKDTSASIVSFKIESQLVGSSTWINNFSGNADVTRTNWHLNVPLIGFKRNKPYTIRLTLTDSLGASVNTVMLLGTEAVPFSIGKHGVGVGKLINNAASEDLQVGTGGISTDGPINKHFVVSDLDVLFKGVSLLNHASSGTGSSPDNGSNANGKYYELAPNVYFLMRQIQIRYKTGDPISGIVNSYQMPMNIEAWNVGGMVLGFTGKDRESIAANFSLLECMVSNVYWRIFPSSYAINISKGLFNNGADTAYKVMTINLWAIGGKKIT